MSFKEPVCRLQLIIKDKHHPHHTHSKPLHILHHQEQNSTEHSPIKWNLHPPSKTKIIEDCLNNQQQPSEKQSTRVSRVVDMMSKVVDQYKRQNSHSKSFRRSNSPKRSMEALGKTKTMTIAQSHIELATKVNIIKDMKQSVESIELKGFKATPSRCMSASRYDLQNRINPSVRCQTAKSTKTSMNMIERGTSSRSILSSRKHTRAMSFNPKNYEEEYQKKLKIFMDFIYKVNYSNGVYLDMQLLSIEAPVQRYKIYVGKGNNQLLLKQLLKRRFWFQFTATQEQYAHFYWTQYEQPNLHQIQICKSTKKGEQAQQITQRPDNQSLVLSKTFQFRKELANSRTTLNCKLMSLQQAEEVEHCIRNNGYNVLGKSFEFVTLTNHIPSTGAITVKKNLLLNLKKYYEDVIDEDPFTVMPRSFHLTEFKGYQVQFFQHLANQDPKKLWMIKPGENSCRAQGIEIWPAPQVLRRIKERWQDEEETCTFIIQSYIENPLLYYDRKFDIRHYMLLTCINGCLKAYWYREGYIRTSSHPFPLVTKIKCRNPLAKKFKNQFHEQLMAWLKKRQIHFTNDVVQIQYDQYGKYENGNKLSYGDLQKYFDYQHGQYSFFQKVVPKMKEIALNVLKAARGQIDPQRRACNFQLLGLDFILDEDFNVWLLEINSNPCLQTNSPVLDRVVPGVLEQVIRLCVQPLLPPHNHFPARQQHNLPPDSLAAMKFELFYQQPS